MTERIRLAYLVPPSAHFAGVERVVSEIADGLARDPRAEFDVHVVYCNEFPELAAAPHSYTLDVLHVDRLRGLARPLRALVRARGFQILVVAQIEPSVPAWIATRGTTVRTFVTHVHGNPQVELERGGISSKVAFWLFRKVVAASTGFVFCVSPSLARHVRGMVGGRVHVRFAPNPVRRIILSDSPPPSGSRRTSFLNIGRLSYQKGQDVLLGAFARVRKELPDSRLTIVGSGEDENELRAYARRLGLADSEIFVGYRPDPSVFFESASQFVLSSRWEGLPGVLLEALQVGLPVVTTACDFGPEDLVESKLVGRVVPVDNVGALADAMIELAAAGDNPEAVRARQAVAERFEPHRAFDRHRELLLQAWNHT